MHPPKISSAATCQIEVVGLLYFAGEIVERSDAPSMVPRTIRMNFPEILDTFFIAMNNILFEIFESQLRGIYGRCNVHFCQFQWSERRNHIVQQLSGLLLVRAIFQEAVVDTIYISRMENFQKLLLRGTSFSFKQVSP